MQHPSGAGRALDQELALVAALDHAQHARRGAVLQAAVVVLHDVRRNVQLVHLRQAPMRERSSPACRVGAPVHAHMWCCPPARRPARCNSWFTCATALRVRAGVSHAESVPPCMLTCGAVLLHAVRSDVQLVHLRHSPSRARRGLACRIGAPVNAQMWCCPPARRPERCTAGSPAPQPFACAQGSRMQNRCSRECSNVVLSLHAVRSDVQLVHLRHSPSRARRGLACRIGAPVNAQMWCCPPARRPERCTAGSPAPQPFA